MKVRIEDDVFDITKRIKDIDEGYYVLYNQNNCKYEIHNFNQKNTYCLTLPYRVLDSRCLDMLLYSSISNIDNIVADIDNNNHKIETENYEKIRNDSDYKLREIFNYANCSSKNIKNNSFVTEWR